jgi:hypothetical protein
MGVTLSALPTFAVSLGAFGNTLEGIKLVYYTLSLASRVMGKTLAVTPRE